MQPIEDVIKRVCDHNKKGNGIYQCSLDEFTVLVCLANMPKLYQHQGVMVIFRGDLYVVLGESLKRMCACENYFLI